jgi:hypothetical protein
MVFRAFISKLKMSSLSMEISDKAIGINKGKKEFHINQSDIQYIFKYNTCLMLIWPSNSTLMTFTIEKSLFGEKTLKEIDSLFKNHKSYINDLQEIRKLRENLKLKHIFRKHIDEYQF